ncbi:MAG: group II intron reverse transcriptase/maturase [Pirellula sp.]
MLTTLEHNSVRGGKWHSLIDKVYKKENPLSAHRKVARNKGAAGVDHVPIKEFTANLTKNISKLEEHLRKGTYQVQGIRRVHIPKPGTRETRPLGIPTVRDRVVQAALRHVIEPILERQFAEHSYGFRPNRGCKDALRRVENLLKKGYRFTVDVDLKSYFDTIPHERLMDELRKLISDNRVLGLVEMFLKAKIQDGLESWTPEDGAPQGAVLSPLLSNLYLNELDHLMASAGYEMTRYADDLVIQCRTPEEAKAALEKVQEWTSQRGLTLHPTKTKIVNVDIEGFEFLGYRFTEHRRYPRRKSMKKLKDSIRSKTRRSNGRSLQAIISDLNKTLRGWYEYFRHSRKTVFPEVDGYVRGRLRSILRKRARRKGRGRGLDHQRYRNSFFAEQGLFSLETTFALNGQPLKRKPKA